MSEEIENKPEEIIREQPKPRCLDKLKIHKFKILVGILGVLIFAGAVFGGYKLGQREIQSGTQPTPVVVATPTPDPTANWKVYTDTKYSYEIKFPKDWTQELVGSFNWDDITAFKAPDESSVEIVVSDSKGLTLEKYLADLDDEQSTGFEGQPSVNVLNSLKTSIAGYPAIEREEEFLAAGFTSRVTYFLVSNQVFSISALPGSDISFGGTQVGEEYFQILSTFKFLEEKTEGEKVFCKDPRPEVCTMECITNPPYICGSDGKSYCSSCQACSNQKVEWYETQQDPCGSKEK